jgi:hypothetical protein
MSEFASSFVETASNYLAPFAFGIAGLIVGGLLVWTFGWKKASRPTRSTVRTTQTGATQSTRAIDFAESQLLGQIVSELGKIEANLSITAAARPNPPALKDKLSSFLERLDSIRSSTQKLRVDPAEPAAVVANFESTPEASASSLRELPEWTFIAPPKPRTFAEEFTDMYNSARDDRDTRNEFWRKYQLAQLGNRNTTDQRMGRASGPDFRTSESLGDFIAVRDLDGENYLVVPSFTVSVDDTSFRFGGIEAAFSCDFAPGSTYQSFAVNTPARFNRDGDNWVVVSRGELLLHA